MKVDNITNCELAEKEIGCAFLYGYNYSSMLEHMDGEKQLDI